MKDRIPTENECIRLQTKYRMLANIAEHSRQVMVVSLAIADNLKESGLINRDLVIASALLHDIAKTRSIETGDWRHDLLGAKMMRDLGCESVARVIESHVILDNYCDTGPLEEREIVYYADKRVLHDTIVSVEARVEDLVERYGVNEEVRALIRDNKKFVYTLEKKIQSFVTKDIDQILSDLCSHHLKK